MSNPRDNWDRAEIVIKALASVLLPVALFVVGQMVTNQQEIAADENLALERLSNLLEPLASDNERERQLAIEVAGYLAKENRLPVELVPVLLNIARSDPSANTAKAASAALLQATANAPALNAQIQADLKKVPARIYFHISSEDQRVTAQGLRANVLSALGEDYVVPSIKVAGGPSQSELRYFKRAEVDEAQRILSALGPGILLRDLSARYEASTGIRPRHYELWLAEDFE